MRLPSRTRPPSLEPLEQRLTPALLEVVPAAGVNGFTTFASLQQALNISKAGDVVQVEPGSRPGDAFVGLIVPGLTIQGDPAFGGAGGLQASNTLVGTLTLNSSGVTVRGLYLNTVKIGAGVTGETITDSVFTGSNNGVLQTFSTGAIPIANGGNTVRGNTFLSDAVVKLGNTAGDALNTAANDKVLDNVFTYDGNVFPLTVYNETTGIQVSGNKLVNPGGPSGAAAIVAIDCTGSIDGNTINVPFFQALVVADTFGTARTTNLLLSDNVITGRGSTTSSGITIQHSSTADTFIVTVSNNALAGNHTGVFIVGNGGGGGHDYGTVTITDNDFRGYTGGAKGFAIDARDFVTVNTSTINAPGNLFSVANPQTAVNTVNALGTVVNTASPLTGGPAALTAMFLTLGGGPPPAGQVAAYQNAPPLTQAVAAVRSAGAVTAFVDSLYVGLLGRAPVGGEDQGWVNALGSAAITEEQLIAGFVGSAEYYGRVGQGSVNPNGAWVESLYLNLLGRQGSAAEINNWLGAAQTQGLAAVAAGIVCSAEFRTLQLDAYNGAPPVGVVPAPDLLKRGTLPTAAEIAGFVFGGQDLRTLQVFLLESAEFAANG